MAERQPEEVGSSGRRRIEDPEERARFVAERRRVHEEDVLLVHLASENVVDAVVHPGDLQAEPIRRLNHATGKDRAFSDRRHGAPPV